MQITTVTSLSLTCWKQYGKKCLMSLADCWPLDVDIYVVSEDSLPFEELGEERSKRFIFIPLLKNVRAELFYNRHKDDKTVKGWGQRGYDFRFDAWRFSKKVFSTAHVANTVHAGHLIWLDADTTAIKPVPRELLCRLPPDDHDIAYLDRGKHHSECGFVGYNLSRPEAMNFIRAFENLYASDKFLDLKEWHDSWIFDWLRKHGESIEAYKIPHDNHPGHPFVHSELGQYMDHLKGGRKKLGISVDHPRYKRKKPS